MELLALITSIIISVTGATTILSYRLGRLEQLIIGTRNELLNEITSVRREMVELERRLTTRIERLEERMDNVVRRIDNNRYVPKQAGE